MSMRDTSECSLRTYQQGDEERLVFLFNKAYERFVGFAPRNLEYWTWCILSRPGLSREGIVVAIEEDQIVGYAAVERSGKILEFCYVPTCNGKAVVSELLEWCVDYARSQGAGSVSLNAPLQDNIVREVCEEMGFTEEPFPSLFLRVLDISHIFRRVGDHKKNVEKDLDETVLIDLRKFPSWSAQCVAVSVRDGEARISTHEVEDPSITIEADISTISACIFGSRSTLYRAILEGRLKIHPFRKILGAVRVLSLFQLNNPPWFVPRADYG